VTVVDALFGEAQLARHPETRKQVALADRLVVTKTDLADAEQVERLRVTLRELAPAAPVFTAVAGAGDVALLSRSFLEPSSSDASVARSSLFAESVDRAHTSRYAVVTLSADRPLRWRAFETWLRRVRIGYSEGLLRVKGMLEISGADGPIVVQGVHHVVNAPVELDAWPEGGRRSRLVLIGDRATIEAARESWAQALPGMIAR
jgi:G3E family GTPase